MKARPLIWGGAALLAMVVAGFLVFRDNHPSPSVTTAPAANPVGGAEQSKGSSLATPGTKAVETVGRNSPAGPSDRLLREFAAAPDLRAFALNALTRPAEGGHFYARYAASICGRDYAAITELGKAAVQEEIRTSGTVPAYRLDMAETLSRRCAAFVTDEAGALVAEVKRKTGRSGDPLLTAERELMDAAREARAGRPDRMRAAVQKLLQLDDPLLWTQHRLWDFVAQSDLAAHKVLGLYLDNKVHSADDVQSHHEAVAALELGFCKPGLPCALDDELLIVCAVGGDCARDRSDKARSMYMANGGSEDGWRRVLALVDRIQTAVRGADVGMFVREK